MKYNVPVRPSDDMLEVIRNRFSYWDGHLINRKGDRVGSREPRGYLCIHVVSKGKRRLIRIHHIIWYLCKGTWPEQEIDHKDQNPGNNNIDNLELSNRPRQAINCVQQRTKKYNLPIGVSVRYTADGSMNYNRFFSSIRYRGKSMRIGCFDDPMSAHQAYKDKYLELYGEPL